jgi:hypothetical protein
MRATTHGCSISAIKRNRSPHAGQASTSMPNVRRINSAHRYPRRVRPPPEGLEPAGDTAIPKPQLMRSRTEAGDTFKLDTVTGEVTRLTTEPPRPNASPKPVARRQKPTPKSEDSGGAVVRGSEEPKTSILRRAMVAVPMLVAPLLC